MSISLTRQLYRGLFRCASKFDRLPLLKVWVNNQNCCVTKSNKEDFRTLVRKGFRDPKSYYKSGSMDFSKAFEIYRDWNEVLYETTKKVRWYSLYEQYYQQKTVSLNPDSPIKLTNKIEPGSILLAHPLSDSIWRFSVVLILQHTPSRTLGLIINKKAKRDETDLPALFPKIARIESKDIAAAEELLKEVKPRLFFGGPITSNSLVLHSDPTISTSHLVSDGVYYDGFTPEVFSKLKQLDEEEPNTPRYRIFQGYAGWEPGQLESELHRGSWFLFKCPLNTIFQQKIMETQVPPPEIPVFPETMSSDLWEKLLRSLGGEYLHYSLVYRMSSRFPPNFEEPEKPSVEM
eukprot:TRINITY_DN3886_c0_g1_i1.p1 TRINITY_DN3886_c0_g1~~TRINITY_DN3886_c0_g1_i1.p1  ORF type:complete len:347 (-),score=56.90 TRINITY_DN3886_c0_g1_i1:57-1097(-)